jgi:hypothetical protein
MLTPTAHGRRTRLVLAGLLALLLALLASGTASALVTKVEYEGSSTTIGLQPRSTKLGSPKAPWYTFDNREGHPVMHSDVVYAIYWDPYYLYHGDWEHLIDTFLQSAGAESGSLAQVFSVNEQYTDKSNTRAAYKMTFRGAYTDTSAYPSSGCIDPDMLNSEGHEGAKLDDVACLTDKQLREELRTFITKSKVKTGMGTIFYLLTPPGVTVCGDGGGLSGHCSDFAWQKNPKNEKEEEPNKESYEHSFCSYHGAITAGQGEGNEATILYAAIPWSVGGAGDTHLFEEARGFDCQDGGYDPAGKNYAEEPEETPHQQEPNQLAEGVTGPDGSFDTGLADLIINQVAVEQQNTVTNPLLNAWQDQAGYEATDECRNDFALTINKESEEKKNTLAGKLYNQVMAGNHYYLNDAFSASALKQGYPGVDCVPGSRLEPQFTSPNAVNAGDIVGFDASESDITMDAGQGYSLLGAVPYNTYPTYTWDFGDGTKTASTDPPGASKVDEPSAFHSYTYGGTYIVTLTVTDVGGNTASTSRPVTVIGPPPPAAASAPSQTVTSPSSPSTTPTTTTLGPTSKAAKEKPAPSLFERIGSHSLSTALREGLLVHYTVNEQVAGKVELMIATSTAKRLHIHGSLAKHLPKGYPRQTLIGSAVLVTTRRGHGQLQVKLLPAVKEALSAMSRLKVTLRIVLRNGDRQHPKTKTLISSFELNG